MATVRFGSARIDENGHATGGRAGDQTGREVSTQSYYLHSKGWRVFRAKDPGVRERIAAAMEAACRNSHIGYDQAQRNTLYSLVRSKGFDPARAGSDCETDCSALVRVCICYAGVTIGDFTTASEPARLLATGAFTELTGEKYTKQSAYLARGDVLVTRTKGHTVVVLSSGAKAEVCGSAVVISGGQCFVRAAAGTSGEILGIAHEGERLDYLGETSANGWLKVQFEDRTGWVSGKYGRVVEG